MLSSSTASGRWFGPTGTIGCIIFFSSSFSFFFLFFLAVLLQLGYDGVEVPVKLPMTIGMKTFKTMLDDHGLGAVVIAFTDGPVAPGGEMMGVMDDAPPVGPGVKNHLDVWKHQIDAAHELDPVVINSHSGNDYWSTDEADEFFTAAMAYDDTVLHETHRKRYLHSPWVGRDALQRLPDLKLVADLSHWVNVAETNTSDPVLTSTIHGIAPNVYHIHGRIGYDHGPQVPDPRAPEWLPYTEGHEAWWSEIWKQQAARGQKVSTFTPEHGPPNYQIAQPYTGQPLADIWEVNHWVALRAATLFAKEHGGEVKLKGMEDLR